MCNFSLNGPGKSIVVDLVVQTFFFFGKLEFINDFRLFKLEANPPASSTTWTWNPMQRCTEVVKTSLVFYFFFSFIFFYFYFYKEFEFINNCNNF